jgi:hypothetical protein
MTHPLDQEPISQIMRCMQVLMRKRRTDPVGGGGLVFLRDDPALRTGISEYGEHGVSLVKSWTTPLGATCTPRFCDVACMLLACCSSPDPWEAAKALGADVPVLSTVIVVQNMGREMVVTQMPRGRCGRGSGSRGGDRWSPSCGPWRRRSGGAAVYGLQQQHTHLPVQLQEEEPRDEASVPPAGGSRRCQPPEIGRVAAGKP